MLEELVIEKKARKYYADIFLYLANTVSDIDDVAKMVDNVFKKAYEQKIEGDLLKQLKELAVLELRQYFIDFDHKFKIFEKDFGRRKIYYDDGIPFEKVLKEVDAKICRYKLQYELSFFDIALLVDMTESEVKRRFDDSTGKLIMYYRKKGNHEDWW